ncbi:MAG: hypothetical protein NBV68_04995 [Erythrobacter sp.]|uniref:hypothetical protein n=1 Tax=Erythrobacter sp. TaxID=1042 RepID=UPI0025F0F9B5|nr:hypothetical protein [Erythrobacter sp.]MCL9998714.1 hypothetical protein [Erythrobacter sp.]
MDQTSPISDAPVLAPSAPVRPQLTLVEARFRLVHPAGEIPEEWRTALGALLGWVGIAAEIVPAEQPRGLKRFADWSMPGAAPLFAPWLGWSPAAFQHGGLASLPQAQFVVSYLVDHPRGAAPGLGGLDLMLMSPHPAQCIAEDAGEVPVPRAGVLAAMIRAARAQPRERLAIIVTARQRNAVATRLLAVGKGLTGTGLTIDLLTLEDALPPLMAARAPWDAVIAMPDLRSTVFTLLSHASGVRRAWPMLWFAGEGPRALRLVTSEAPGEGASRLPLYAAALIHTLALTLNAAGAGGPAARLHEAWALLRDSGVTTPGHGQSGAPYASEVADSAFVAMLCRGEAVSKRPQRPWRALQNDKNASAGSQTSHLRVISSHENITTG